tara:strand:- start:24 stop:440 length:417 start_codon:yes stop_codon:yes gene_type:complete
LADEMGLGKTISIIGGMNVLLDRHFNYDKQSMVDSDTSKTIMSDKRKLSSRATQFQTLIVAPKSVLSHWEYELTKWLTINDEKKKGKFKFKIGTVKAKQGIPDLKTYQNSTRNMGNIVVTDQVIPCICNHVCSLLDYA